MRAWIFATNHRISKGRGWLEKRVYSLLFAPLSVSISTYSSDRKGVFAHTRFIKSRQALEGEGFKVQTQWADLSSAFLDGVAESSCTWISWWKTGVLDIGAILGYGWCTSTHNKKAANPKPIKLWFKLQAMKPKSPRQRACQQTKWAFVQIYPAAQFPLACPPLFWHSVEV